MEPISTYLHLLKRRDEQNVSRTPIVNQDPLNVEIGNCGRDDQCIIMWEIHASQNFVGEGDGLVHSNSRSREVVHLFLSLNIPMMKILHE